VSCRRGTGLACSRHRIHAGRASADLSHKGFRRDRGPPRHAGDPGRTSRRDDAGVRLAGPARRTCSRDL